MTDAGFASLCFLSYRRPEFILESIRSAVSTAGYPCEVIVHDDGSDTELQLQLLDLLAAHEISRLIVNPPGHNEGVGMAINRTFKLAAGDPIIKIDQDLLFHQDWLARVAGILRQDEAVGMLGLFKYHHEPVPWEKMRIEVPTKGGYHYTRQFCGSAMAVPRRVYEDFGPFDEHSDAFAEDSAYMARLRVGSGSLSGDALELALPDVDLCHNRGFGIGPSTVVEHDGKVHKIHHGPHVLNQQFAATANEPAQETPEPPPAVEVQGIAEPDLLPEAPGPFEYDWTLPPAVIDGAMAATHDFKLPAPRFDVGVVITTCAGREENLQRCLHHIGELRGRRPELIVVVFDGCPHDAVQGDAQGIPIWKVPIDKHEPGREQPRNVGFNAVRAVMPKLNYVWFLDADIIVAGETLASYYEALCAAPEDRVLIGPYDWLPQGFIGFIPELKDGPCHGAQPDYRWASFKEHGPEHVFRHDLGCGLACFGGNLVWPVEAFTEVGGFHPDLHHGRCEDGELGLRACERGTPMSLVAGARGWHVWHPVDMAGAVARNQRDVPLLNAMHPWVQDEGLRVVDEDGKRFDWKCPQCEQVCNSLDYWPHAATHR